MGDRIFYFRRATAFCLGYLLSKQKITGYSKNVGGAKGPRTLLATPMETASQSTK